MPVPSPATSRVPPRLLKRRDQLALGDMLQRLAVLDPDALHAIRLIARDALRDAHRRHQRYLPKDILNKLCFIIALATLSACCQQPPSPYQLSPAAPTVQTPTRLTLSALVGQGESATRATLTATVLDQDSHGIANTPLSFASEKGSLSAINLSTNSNGTAQTVLTSGVSSRVTVAGAGMTTAIDVAISAPLSVSLSLRAPEKRVPTAIVATSFPTATPPARYVWAFGDGSVAETTVPTVTHTWADDGRVTLAVTITDNLERTGTGTAQITVRDNPEPPAPPAPDPPPGPTLTVTLSASPGAGQWKVAPIVLTPTATPANGAGSVLSYDWDLDGDGKFTDATTVGPLTVNSPTAPQYPAIGTYTTKVRANSTTIGVTGTASVLVAITN